MIKLIDELTQKNVKFNNRVRKWEKVEGIRGSITMNKVASGGLHACSLKKIGRIISSGSSKPAALELHRKYHLFIVAC